MDEHMTPAGARAGWSQDDGVRFEVARNVLAQLIGYAATRIDGERRDEQNDQPADEPADERRDEQTVGSAWRRRQKEWASRRLALTPGDPDVERVLAEQGPLLRRLLAGRDIQP